MSSEADSSKMKRKYSQTCERCELPLSLSKFTRSKKTGKYKTICKKCFNEVTGRKLPEDLKPEAVQHNLFGKPHPRDAPISSYSQLNWSMSLLAEDYPPEMRKRYGNQNG